MRQTERRTPRGNRGVRQRTTHGGAAGSVSKSSFGMSGDALSCSHDGYDPEIDDDRCPDCGMKMEDGDMRMGDGK